MSTRRAMYALGLVCILAGLVVGGLVQRLFWESSASTALGDGAGLVCMGAGAFFFLRGLSSRADPSVSAKPRRSKANLLYTIAGAVLAVLLFVAVLYLTGSH